MTATTKNNAMLARARRQLSTDHIAVLRKPGGYQLIDRAGGDTVIDAIVSFDLETGAVTTAGRRPLTLAEVVTFAESYAE